MFAARRQKVTIFCITITIGIIICTIALGYGLILTPNGYYVLDDCYWTRQNASIYCEATADVWHSETGAYKNHYSNATINVNGRYGTIVAQSGKIWCGNNLQSYASVVYYQNSETYAGYGWWGGVY
jgi:hypothetical protein